LFRQAPDLLPPRRFLWAARRWRAPGSALLRRQLDLAALRSLEETITGLSPLVLCGLALSRANAGSRCAGAQRQRHLPSLKLAGGGTPTSS
jgi:hypothetical protein